MVAYGKVSLQVPKTNHIERAYHGFNAHINPCDWPKQLQHWSSFAATLKFWSSSYTSTQQTLAHTSISAIFSLSLGTLARSPLQFTEWTQWTDLAYVVVDVILDVYPLCPGDSVLFFTIASFPNAPLMLPKQALQQMRWPKRFEPGNMQLKVLQLEPYLLIPWFFHLKWHGRRLLSTKNDTEPGGIGRSLIFMLRDTRMDLVKAFRNSIFLVLTFCILDMFGNFDHVLYIL